jgi:hypothetical protein
MTVKFTRPSINIRETLDQLNKPSGIAGNAMLAAETPQEQFNLIGAGRKNLIINGAMQVSQRGASFSTQGHTLDRWYLNLSGGSGIVTSSTFAAGSEVNGIKNYLALDVTAGNDYLGMVYKVEGARSLPTGKATLSWWAKGVNPAGGAFDCNIQLIPNGITAFNTPLSDSFYVTSTWQKYVRVVDIPSYAGMATETSDGSWTYVRFSQPAGDTSTDAWSLDITGVQLEAGSVATPFEHRSYGEELALCQRYYQRVTAKASFQGTRWSSEYYCSYSMPVTMRGIPSFLKSSGGAFRVYGAGSSQLGTAASMDDRGKDAVELIVTSPNVGVSAFIRFAASTDWFSLDAEL